MSEARLISPLLDGFALGGSISTHSGVSCYPAMRNDSDERYIVKTISIPASQVQLEALLLTGAYPNAEVAQGYFKDLAKGIRSEIEVLEKLAAQRGFLSFNGYQIVPMEEGVGYEVYLVSYYRRTLERQLRQSPMTHLAAVNMGIDLCAALAVCRESGYLYVNLKPGNIFLEGQQDFYIGDLGFVALDSLKFASLPDRCRSFYIPPEIADAYATLNTTMDTYALGLVLYQVFNNGQLPFDSEESRKALMDRMEKGESMPAPMYADYEMAEIILKACAFNPEDRWQSPDEMGQALISYMQRNEVNDVPIVPPVVDEPVVDFLPEEPDEELPDENGETAAEPEQDGSDESAPAQEADWIDRMDAILSEDEPEEDTVPEDEDTIPLRDLLTNDIHAPAADANAPMDTEELSDDTAGILSLVQELIEHEAPEPAVAPEPIEIPMPDPIVLESETKVLPVISEVNNSPAIAEKPVDDYDEDEDDDEDDDYDEPYIPAKPKKFGKIVALVVALLVLVMLGMGGYHFYTNYYLQPVTSITAEGQADQMTVTVITDADESLLTVICKDQHGNPMRAALENGTATFTQLTPGTQYLISLEISGLHKLTGNITTSYATPARTQIVNFTAVTGAEDGSVLLKFDVEGPESEIWTLHYYTEGEEERSVTFSGKNAAVTGLTVGSEYTFYLTAGEDIYLIGDHAITYVASSLVLAENLTVAGYDADSITANWSAPEGVVVTSWITRCYNEDYDQTIETSEPTATFTGISPDASYTVEITAVGMTVSTRIFVTANPITITEVTTQVVNGKILVDWKFDGLAPEDGWLVLYQADEGTEHQVIKTTEPHAEITPIAPGSHYDIVIQTADATSTFGDNTGSADVPDTGTFSGFGLTASVIEVNFYQVPEKANWTRKDLTAADKKTVFAPGEDIAILYYTNRIYDIDDVEINTMFVIRDGEGKLFSISNSVRTWDEMWLRGYCEYQFTDTPTVAGNYTMEIYLNGAMLKVVEFSVQ